MSYEECIHEELCGRKTRLFSATERIFSVDLPREVTENIFLIHKTRIVKQEKIRLHRDMLNF